MTSNSCPSPAVSIKHGERFLSIGEVLEKTSFRSKTSIYDLEHSGDFPSRISVFGRRIAWLESEIEEWMASRVALRNNSPEKEKK
jgi:prophage regulatory protein